jgi:hypothetical protein
VAADGGAAAAGAAGRALLGRDEPVPRRRRLAALARAKSDKVRALPSAARSAWLDIFSITLATGGRVRIQALGDGVQFKGATVALGCSILLQPGDTITYAPGDDAEPQSWIYQVADAAFDLENIAAPVNGVGNFATPKRQRAEADKEDTFGSPADAFGHLLLVTAEAAQAARAAADEAAAAASAVAKALRTA